jgi:PAS domain S-box-containing protein
MSDAHERGTSLPAEPTAVRSEEMSDATTVGLAIKDPAGRYRWTNATYRALHALGDQPIVGRTDAELLAPRVARVRHEREERVLASQAAESFRDDLDGLGVAVSGEVLCLSGESEAVVAILCASALGPVAGQLGGMPRRLADPRLTGPVGSYAMEIGGANPQWSATMYEIYGRDPSLPLALEDILSQQVSEQGMVVDEVWAQMDTERPYSVVHRIRRMDGQIRVLQSRGHVMAGEDGKPKWVVGTDQDITDQLDANEQVERLFAFSQRVLDSIAEAICVIDTNGVVTFANRAAAEELGVGGESLVGQPLISRLDGEDCAAKMAALLHDTRGGRGRTRVRDSDRTLEYACATLQADGEIEGAVVTFRDVTDRHEQERRLQATLDDLDVSHQERGALLEALVSAQELERKTIAGEVHDDSVQVMGAVGLALDGLLRRTTDETEAERLTELREVVQGATSRLRNLLFTLSPPALATGVANAIDAYARRLAEDHGLDVQVTGVLSQEPPMTTRLVLYRIAQEALTNAARHAQASRIDVTLLDVRRGLLMTIADDGIGIPEHAGGAAGHVGLSSMRHRAEIAGGRCRVEANDPDPGTTVTVLLPHPSEEIRS